MALPIYTPAKPDRAYFRGVYDEVYGPHPNFNFGTLVPSDPGDDLSSKTQVPVNKSRPRKCWDAVWAKPKHWWSTRSESQRASWLYALAVFLGFCLVAILIATVYVGVSFGATGRWSFSDPFQSSDIVKRQRQEVRNLVVSGSAWPTETNVGLLSTPAASPSIVAVSFTA
ncbi:uncharacterized protein N7496_005836 [Penicillium cataractarum]|uniref:Uncharacterized protein n=1 Tax=Penicillium cataractarum TaxID=2100454 RepID=A0A9W9V6S7_9EURO|nr:uncharacterized protein N7496_005836 [Penicillium cataractarum]KAJ5369744.1 hypothetical protein N7496_005836 [Penicillium cataractarum]